MEARKICNHSQVRKICCDEREEEEEEKQRKVKEVNNVHVTTHSRTSSATVPCL